VYLHPQCATDEHDHLQLQQLLHPLLLSSVSRCMLPKLLLLLLLRCGCCRHTLRGLKSMPSKQKERPTHSKIGSQASSARLLQCHRSVQIEATLQPPTQQCSLEFSAGKETTPTTALNRKKKLERCHCTVSATDRQLACSHRYEVCTTTPPRPHLLSDVLHCCCSCCCRLCKLFTIAVPGRIPVWSEQLRLLQGTHA
jgi:hypothetical protein